MFADWKSKSIQEMVRNLLVRTSNPHSVSHNVCGRQLSDLSYSLMSVLFPKCVSFPLDEIHLLSCTVLGAFEIQC
jgi:hypothetical protein